MTKGQWAKLGDEGRQIKVAELCGWRDIIRVDNQLRGFTPDKTHPSHSTVTSSLTWRIAIPDYLNDLNAMASAEKLLNFETAGAYDAWLKRLVETPYNYVWSATAAEKAEAFVLIME